MWELLGDQSYCRCTSVSFTSACVYGIRLRTPREPTSRKERKGFSNAILALEAARLPSLSLLAIPCDDTGIEAHRSFSHRKPADTGRSVQALAAATEHTIVPVLNLRWKV